MKSDCRLITLSLFVLLSCAACSHGEDVNFKRDIFPMLQQHCVRCHGAKKQEGQLRLDSRVSFLEGGVSGKLIDRKSPGKSLLLLRVAGESEGEQMPLEAKPLAAKQIGMMEQWIRQGAAWPDGIGVATQVRSKHWAYEPRMVTPLETVPPNSWSSNPIDRFVFARLKQHDLQPSVQEEPARLLRRVYLDLIGVPPTLDEIKTFESNPSARAYEQVVDRLLASPEYGVKWARRWLDLARYADSNGYQADQYRNVWPYRDWVVKAMNSDMPFDQFTIEQLAGDLLPNATIAQKTATGFYRQTTCNVEAGVDPESNRVDQIIDRVNTTGTVWLGTTLECAQCHNHKYDPFTQEDYYKVFAFLNNTPIEVEGNGVTYNFVGPKLELPLNKKQQAQRNSLDQQLAGLRKKKEVLRSERASDLPQWLAKQPAQPTLKWTPLKVVSFKSTGGATHRILKDQSVLLSGKNPAKDTYIVELAGEMRTVQGVRLEALTHESLPGKGPGRFSKERPNFVLNEFELVLTQKDGKKVPIKLEDGTADFSQKNFPVNNAVDGNLSTGWAINPKFHEPHTAEFAASKSINVKDGQLKLSAKLVHNFGGGRSIGRLRISVANRRPGRGSKLPVAVAKAIAKPERERSAAEKKKILDHFISGDKQLKQIDKQIAAVQNQIKNIKPITTLVMVEAASRKTNVLMRGDFRTPGKDVQPGVPKRLHPLSSGADQSRLGFAKWLVDRDNPLTARVVVNRWWAEMFGAGIVRTQEDFGTQGDRPTHPALLDFLANELLQSNWSRKSIHRMIVLSRTYQQSSRVDQNTLQNDPINRWYSRGPRIRLSAELIRDNALAISGLLTHKQGGAPIFPPQPAGIWRHVGRNAPVYDTSKDEDRFRRGLYVIWRRSAPYASFTNFDAPDRASCVVDRGRTNTPLQALTLLNDDAYIEMAKHFADRIKARANESGTDSAIEWAFRRCVARKPSWHEMNILKTAFADAKQRYSKAPDGIKELVLPKSEPSPAAAAWFHIANILLNLDETITKG